jgi:penicillin-binding protein 1A
MKGALVDKPPTPFRVPPGIEFVTMDRLTGAVVPPGTPGSIQEAFKQGTAPGEPGAPQPMVIGGDEPAVAGPANGTTGVEEGSGGLY